ncbi:MAG: hypothetical protein ACRDXB_19210, partial [Actinomycetes bacterium]
MPLVTQSRTSKPASSTAGLPEAPSLLRAMRTGATAELRDPHPVLTISVRLGAQHRRQWAAEDLTRQPDATDADIVDTKRT